MSDDVTIPRETARTAGEDIRLAILTTDDTGPADRLDRLADLLDQTPTPKPTCKWESCENPTKGDMTDE